MVTEASWISKIYRIQNCDSDEESDPFVSTFDVLAFSDFRSRHLHLFPDFIFSTFWNHFLARREILRILQIPDNCRRLFKGFPKAEAGLEMDSENPKGNLKEKSSDPSRPAAGWLSNALHFIVFS